jgi:AcrR family transcriptional regulator
MSKADTRTQILDAAIYMFWRRSYHSINMNALSVAAGVNKARVYQHFGSKEDLAIAAVKCAAERTEDYIYQSTFNESDDPATRLRIIYDKAYAMHASFHRSEGKCRGCPFVNLGVELATESEGVRLAVNAAFDGFRKYYDEIVEQATGAVKDDVVASLLANMNGCLVASNLENCPEAVLDGQKRALQLSET